MLDCPLLLARTAPPKPTSLLVVLLSAASASAWGPHSQITQAALDALGTNDALVIRLGAQAQRLTNYCWMGDYFGVVMEEPDELFYADDYLLFPEAPRYFDHTGPDVQQAFGPFFRRALQAWRTENPANAARWIGALLHFVQDAGCPPHAAGLRGDVHVNMEGWVETNQIRIPDYTVQSLGATEAQALQGLLSRLEELIPAARQQGRRLRVAVEIGNQSAVKPVILRSALDCARLTADLLHTLGRMGQADLGSTANLQGTISGAPAVGMEQFPAKIILRGTSFSTLTDLLGRFEFRHLPPGSYRLVAIRPGSGLAQTNLQLRAHESAVCHLALPADAGSLVLNGDFTLAWVRPPAPDYWYQTKSGWEGQVILLRSGQRYRLAASIKDGPRHDIVVRWTHPYEHARPRFQIEPRFERQTLTVDTPEILLTGGPDCGLLHITIRGRTPPASVCERISLTALPADP